jgi:hypothetical protein
MKTVPTVYELRKQGWKVRVGHHRKYFRYDAFSGRKFEKTLLRKDQQEDYPNFFLDARGGVTTVVITIPEYDRDFTGVAECSDEEHYKKSTGLKKALARALSSYVEDKRLSGN